MTDTAPEVYHFDQTTGEYIGYQPARQSPAWTDKDPPGEKYLLPAWATFTAPDPVPGPGQALVWDNGQWVLVENHRGEVWYDPDGKRVTISSLGPIPDGYTETPPVANDNG